MFIPAHIGYQGRMCLRLKSRWNLVRCYCYVTLDQNSNDFCVNSLAVVLGLSNWINMHHYNVLVLLFSFSPEGYMVSFVCETVCSDQQIHQWRGDNSWNIVNFQSTLLLMFATCLSGGELFFYEGLFLFCLLLALELEEVRHTLRFNMGMYFLYMM